MSQQRSKSVCDFLKVEGKPGFFVGLFSVPQYYCFVTTTKIPDEHKCVYCCGNFFLCKFFNEYLKSRVGMKTVRVVR